MLNLGTNDIRFTAKLLGHLDWDKLHKEYKLDDEYLNDLRTALVDMATALESTGQVELDIDTTERDKHDCTEGPKNKDQGDGHGDGEGSPSRTNLPSDDRERSGPKSRDDGKDEDSSDGDSKEDSKKSKGKD